MYIDRNEIEEYPFTGVFTTTEIDSSKPLDEQVEVEVEVLRTRCDIQESSKNMSGGITASYAIYFPFDRESGVVIKNGMEFAADMYGLRVNGEVRGVFPSQLGGCVAYITDKNV